MEGFYSAGAEARALVRGLQRSNPDLFLSSCIKAAWNRIADAGVSRHVVGVYVIPETDGHEVIVYVDTPICAADFTMQAEMLRLKLNMKLADMAESDTLLRDRIRASDNHELIERLRFIVSKQKYLKKERRQSTAQELDEEAKRYARAKPVALNSEETRELEGAVSGIDDEELRQAVFDAAKANIEWQKGLRKSGLS